MKKLYIPIIAFIGLSINTFAQEKSSNEIKGDKYAFKYSYTEAIDAYNSAKPLTVDGQRRLAESYHKMNQNTQSEIVYSKLINAATGVLPEDYYSYAMVLKANGKTEESNKAMDKFNELKPDDLRGIDYMTNKGEWSKWTTDSSKYKIVHLDVNTDAEDFGTCFYQDKIVFSSSRQGPKFIKRVDNWTGKPFLDIYVSEIDHAQLKKPSSFDKGLNTKMHDGPSSFNKEGTYMAFTSDNYDVTKKDKIVQLEIYFSNFKNGQWQKAEPFVLNNKEYSVGHPSLTADGNTMYFSCNMPGGFGGADIYKITKDGTGNWGKAENLGNKINTEGDELFPFYEEKKEKLFFASNGRFGLGGLDIFICEMNNSQIVKVYNAGAPLNSSADDFAAIANDSTATGYFSSNRGSVEGDDDIYSVDFLKLEILKKINGFAKNKEGSSIPKTFITLSDDKDILIDTLTTKDDGSYSFSVASDKNFKLNGKKETYTDGNNTASTFGKELFVNADLELAKIEEPKKEEVVIAEKIKPGADLGKILKLDPIYFDYKKFNIRPDAEKELKKIIKIMNEYPEMTVELSAFTDCRASKAFNQKLSEKRADESAWYIKKRITKPERIYGRGYGETRPVNRCTCEGTVVSDCSENEQQQNRRTEFIIIKNPSLVKQ
jgi:outer membrane protein OmpA-like peptidoglycan-associated protein